jgi:hypothetical protein
MKMKRFVAALMSLVLISCSEFKSGVAVDQGASSTRTIQPPDHTSKTDADRHNVAQPAALVAPLARRPDSVSPFEIKQYIEQHQEDEFVSLAEYWNRLGIDNEEWVKYGKCEVAIYELALGRNEGTDVMLRLYDLSSWSMGGTRYLFFKPITTAHKPEWRLLGYIDFQDQRYAVPGHRVITSGADHWLVLSIMTGRGSGYSLNHDEWYEIDDNGVKLVLSYPSSKFLSWRDPIPVLEASSKVISATEESDRTKVVIEFTASYVLYGGAHFNERIELWTKTQRAAFVRGSRLEPFGLDGPQSQLSDTELDAVYDGEGPSNSEILRYNFDDLERIATGTNERTQEWLRSYLSECRNSTYRERLLRALAH